MRRLKSAESVLILSIVLSHIFLILPVFGGEIYSFIDANGVRNFTDRPNLRGGKIYSNSGLGTIKIYKCIDAQGIIHLTDRSRGPCYKLIYQSGDFQPFSSYSYSGRSRIHDKYDDYYELVGEVAAQTFLEPELLHAVIQTESAYNPHAVSPKGAVGLMQLMPATARRYGVVDRTDVSSNLYGGARYLRYLLELFNNDKRLALAGYNAGENAVIRYGNQIPPYRETQHYVDRVMALYETHLSRR